MKSNVLLLQDFCDWLWGTTGRAIFFLRIDDYMLRIGYSNIDPDRCRSSLFDSKETKTASLCPKIEKKFSITLDF